MSFLERQKRCLYVVLGVSRDCTTDEIRSSYKKLALQCHPDKSLLSKDESTAQFQELENAYTVLSDLHKRALYDSELAGRFKTHEEEDERDQDYKEEEEKDNVKYNEEKSSFNKRGNKKNSQPSRYAYYNYAMPEIFEPGKRPNNPYFIGYIRPSIPSRLVIPKKFIEDFHSTFVLPENTVIRDISGEEWSTKLKKQGEKVFYYGGWFEFCKKYKVKKGDKCIVEFIEENESCIIKLRCL